MAFYSAKKRKAILTHATKWMKLGDSMLSEVSQIQKDKHWVLLPKVPAAAAAVDSEPRGVKFTDRKLNGGCQECGGGRGGECCWGLTSIEF